MPQTLLRIVSRPRRMCAYAASELAIDDDKRFNDSISPPLLLILCVLIAHFVDLAVRAQTPEDEGTLAGVLLGSEQNLLLYRTMAFGIWALAGSVYSLARVGIPLSREKLRVPLYEQRYLVAPFALVISVCTSLTLAATDARTTAAAALAVTLAGIWFWVVQVRWITLKARLPLWRGLIAGTLILAIGAAANAAIGYAITGIHVETSPAPDEAASGVSPRLRSYRACGLELSTCKRGLVVPAG